MRDKIWAIISIIFVFCGFIGMHSDWTMPILVIPFGWVIVGLFLDWLINGHGTKESLGNAVCGSLILLNMSVIMIHRDTLFIIGRILACLGLVILIIRATKNSEELTRKEVEDELIKMREECAQLNRQIDVLVKNKL